MRPRIGLAVPSLELNGGGGGVASVARFLKNAAIRCGAYDLTLISLATSAFDRRNLSLARPDMAPRRHRLAGGMGRPAAGACGRCRRRARYRRYLPRRVLTEAVADCDILQVVCGFPPMPTRCPVSASPCQCTAPPSPRSSDAGGMPILAGFWVGGESDDPTTERIDDRALRSADAIQVMNSWMYTYTGNLNAGRDVDLRLAPPGVDAHPFCPAAHA